VEALGPLTALNDALRASILEGTSPIHQWPRLLVMFLCGGISFAVAEVVSVDLVPSHGNHPIDDCFPKLGPRPQVLGESTNEAGPGACESITILTT
jgi:hypothetical protein